MFLEDMDTSESEHDENEDDEWVEPGKRPIKKRGIRNGGRSSGEQDANWQENAKTENSGEAVVPIIRKSEHGLCCSCSKYSSCKTTKCECRAALGICGPSCGCSAIKCSNRQGVMVGGDEASQIDVTRNVINDSGSDETEKNNDLASHGAMLLQSALSEKPAATNEAGETRRKPLSDIGNRLVSNQIYIQKLFSFDVLFFSFSCLYMATSFHVLFVYSMLSNQNLFKQTRKENEYRKLLLVFHDWWDTLRLFIIQHLFVLLSYLCYNQCKQAKSNAPKPERRKKWKKSLIQLVPVTPPASQPEVTEPPKKQDNSSNEADIPLKLPRAMRSAASNASNLLKERNADKSDEIVNKESVLPPSSPARPKRTSEEKENCKR